MNDITYTKKDFVSGQEVRWCPGCGDYSVLASIQSAMAKMGKKKEDYVCVSGIGCSSRFPYYMNTYGMHTIHGRPAAIASGLKAYNPKLSVWVITGDGDAMSIGGNHMIHTLRRNIDLKIVMFNNEIYGLTKGQYSPTTKKGTITKSSPYGTIERPFNTAALALGAGATFFARTIDTDPKHIEDMMMMAAAHKGTAFIEVYQNCVIFSNKIHDAYTNRLTRSDNTLRLEHGKPLIFGKDKNKAIVLDGFSPKIVTIGEDGYTENDPRIIIHDETDMNESHMLSYMMYPDFPLPIGVYQKIERETYEKAMEDQIQEVIQNSGPLSMEKLLTSGSTWKV